MDFGKLLMYYYCNSKKTLILLSQLSWLSSGAEFSRMYGSDFMTW